MKKKNENFFINVNVLSKAQQRRRKRWRLASWAHLLLTVWLYFSYVIEGEEEEGRLIINNNKINNITDGW